MTEEIGNSIKKIRKTTVAGGMWSELGKLPPQAIETEEAVLGALMLERDAISTAIEILRPESFYKDEHKEIYEAILNLFGKSQPIDLLTVTNELRLTAKLEFAGGAYYISELTNRVGSAANLEYHARIVAQKYILRKLIEVSSKIQTDAFEETTDVFDLLDRTEKDLFSITEQNLRNAPDSMSVLINKAIKQMEEIKLNTDGMSGIGSGFTALDRITSGWQRSDLIILAARPGMGKTAFVLGLARNAAIDFNKPVAIFSLEMSSIQLVQRLISSESEISSMKLRNGDLRDHEWQQLNSKISKLTQAKIFIDDTPALNVFELRAKCRRLKAQYDIDMVIIDYLQLMSGNRDGKSSMNREQEISAISRSLKGLAKELNIPVIALSQLSRAVEQRGATKKPILSDLRESGSIEQDADQVLFIYRPEYYGLTEDENGNPTQGLAEIIIAKNRHGALETVPLRFIDKYARFTDYDDFSFSAAVDDSHPSPSGSAITKQSRMNQDDDDVSDVPF